MDTDIDLSKVSLLAIMGHNGSGKSSIFDALVWGWYGKSSSRGTKSDSIARHDSDETQVTIDWYINDIKYALTRTRDNKKNSQKLELSVNGEVISERKKTEVEELLGNILKIPMDLYSITNGLQQDGKSFLDLKPIERKAHLSNILQLENYKKVQIEAKSLKNKLTTDKSSLHGQYKVNDDDLTRSIEYLAEKPALEQQLIDLEIKKTKVETFLARASEEKVEEKQKRLNEKLKLQTAIDIKKKNLEDIQEKIKSDKYTKLQKTPSDRIEILLDLIDSLGSVGDRITEKIGNHRTNLVETDTKYKATKKILNGACTLEIGVPCPTCRQEVMEDHIDKIKDLYEREADSLNDLSVQLLNLIETLQQEKEQYAYQIRDADKELLELKNEEALRARLVKELEVFNDNQKNLRDEIEALQEKHDSIEAKPVSEEVLIKIKQAEEAKLSINSQSQALSKRINQAELVQDQYDRQRTKKQKILEEIKTIENQIEIYNLIIDACHPQKGIPAKIIENSLFPLEKITNDLLEHFPGTYKFNVYFKTLTDDGKETLELMVKKSNSKIDKYYEQLSEGEKVRISLALRVALIRMINNMYGIENRTLIIDEGFHALSTDIRASAFEILASLQGVWFDKILTITHSQEIADCIPHRLELKKDEMNDCTIISYKNF
jgi:exonuclease SbcC